MDREREIREFVGADAPGLLANTQLNAASPSDLLKNLRTLIENTTDGRMTLDSNGAMIENPDAASDAGGS